MRAVVQRVTQARVLVDGAPVSSIDRGLLVLLGVGAADTPETARALAAKTVALRLFDDSEGRINRSVLDTGGSILCVSQFTLYGDVRKGNRPSFTAAARPEDAEALYDAYCTAVEEAGIRCARGVFRATMEVESTNDGPVTLILDSDDLARPRRAQT